MNWNEIPNASKYDFNCKLFGADFPQYKSLIKKLKLDGKNTNILVEDAKRNIHPHFNVAITYHSPGQIIKDLKLAGRSGLPNHNVCGYMSPTHKGSSEFYIAVEAIESKSMLITSTLTHELGHYVEERIRLINHHPCSISFEFALDVLHKYKICSDDVSMQNYLADEWVAWIHSVWISK